jgi:hypothetical protein
MRKMNLITPANLSAAWAAALALAVSLPVAAQTGQPAQTAATDAKSAPTPQVTEATDAATKSATTWLRQVDGGKYPESWDQASKGFRDEVARNDWTAALTSLRTPLGTPTTRTLKSAQLTRELPNAPPGEYVVIQFDTAFEKKPGSVETVVAVRDADRAWRVTGYFIK